jgi:hypothetical protein
MEQCKGTPYGLVEAYYLHLQDRKGNEIKKTRKQETGSEVLTEVLTKI